MSLKIRRYQGYDGVQYIQVRGEKAGDVWKFLAKPGTAELIAFQHPGDVEAAIGAVKRGQEAAGNQVEVCQAVGVSDRRERQVR